MSAEWHLHSMLCGGEAVRWRCQFLLGLALWCASNVDALADKRVALVIGNSAYQNATRLSNPGKDATAVSLLLKSAGFEVVEMYSDLGTQEMRRAVRDFSDSTRDSDVAVVFY